MTESDSVTCIKSDKGFPCRKRHLPGTAHTTSYGSECSELVQVHCTHYGYAIMYVSSD